MFSLLKKKLLKPFFVMNAQLLQVEQNHVLLAAQLDKLRHVTAEHKAALSSVEALLAAELGELRQRADQSRESLEDAKKFLRLDQEHRRALDLEIKQQFTALLAEQFDKLRQVTAEHKAALSSVKALLAAELGELRQGADQSRESLEDAKKFLRLDQEHRRELDLEIKQQFTALFMQRRRIADGKERGEVYFQGLRAVGVLNYENDIISGERRFLTRFLEQFPTAVVLDVGANVGQYAQLVRELGPRTAVHCFEPHPTSFAELALTAERIGVTAHRFALGDSRSEIEFFDYIDQAGSQHASVYREVIEELHRRPSSSQKVRCETLDKVTSDLGLTHIGLLKIDTEGHELAVLKGARSSLETNAIDVIQFEFNEMNVISRVFMKDFFALLPNYRIFRLLADGAIGFETYDPTFMEVFAYQNIVCIRRDLDPFWIHGN